jgi:hypothetical protein
MKKSDNQSLIPNLFIEYFKCIVTGHRVAIKAVQRYIHPLKEFKQFNL